MDTGPFILFFGFHKLLVCHPKDTHFRVLKVCQHATIFPDLISGPGYDLDIY